MIIHRASAGAATRACRIAALAMALPLAFAATCSIAGAQDNQSADAKRESEFQAAATAAQSAAIGGPKDIPVAGQGMLHLPEGYIFVPQPEAGKFSRALGNGESPRLVGIVSSTQGGGWLAYLDYMDDGHVKDDDAKTWNADELLKGLQDGTESGNEDRAARGFPAIEVAGWIEKPAYDASAHRLVWSALVKRKNEEAGAVGSANYNTYALGRDGHFELNLVTSADKVEGFKADAKTLLAALAYDTGRRYEDFNASTDRVAQYGLAALIGGVAAKKLGLLAVMAAFAAKFAKIIAVAAIALIAGLKSFFSRKGSGQ